MFSLASIAIFSLSSFTTVDEVAHTCRYRIYNAKTGATLGYVVISDVPDNVACGSQQALDAALATWQALN